MKYWRKLNLRHWRKSNKLMKACLRNLGEIPDTNVSYKIFLFELSIYLSKTILSHKSFLSWSLLPIFWLEIDICALLLIYCVLSSFYYVWLICIRLYIPLELSFVHWCRYRDLFLFHVLTTHQAKHPTIMFHCFDHILPHHCFTFGIVFCMCASYKFGK